MFKERKTRNYTKSHRHCSASPVNLAFSRKQRYNIIKPKTVGPSTKPSLAQDNGKPPTEVNQYSD